MVKIGKPNILVHSGNRIRVRFQGNEIGLVQNIRATDDYGSEPASGIGDLRPIEYVPSMARHTVNVGWMALRRDNAIVREIYSENAAIVLKGLVFDIEVMDKDTGDLLRKYVSCSFVSGDMEFQKHAIVLQNAQFMALDAVGTMSAPITSIAPTEATV